MILSNVSVKYLHSLVLHLLSKDDLIGVSLGLGEDDGLSVKPLVTNQEVSESGIPVVVGAVDGQVSHCLRSLVLEVSNEVEILMAVSHVVLSDPSDPGGHRG